MSKCILLVRVSTAAQELQSQEEKVREAALNSGYRAEDIITISDTESATRVRTEDRHGLSTLKKYIESDPTIDTVFVYEISRISRKASALYQVRDYLQQKKVQLICLTPPITLFNLDWSISTGAAMLFSVFSTLSEQETFIRKERTMRGKLKKKEEGSLTSGKPLLGYTLSKEKRPIPNETSSTILQIFTRYVSGDSVGMIAKDIYELGLYPSTTKYSSVYSNVSRILHDPRYAGINSIYPAIVPVDIFEKVQSRFSSQSSYFGKKCITKNIYLLQGIIVNEDGYSLTPSAANNRYCKMNDPSQKSISLNLKVVDDISAELIKRYCEEEYTEERRKKELKELETERSQNSIKISNIEDKIVSLEKENDLIQSRIIKGRLSEVKGDAMIEENLSTASSLEDRKVDLVYRNSYINNRIIYLNSFLYTKESLIDISDKESVRRIITEVLEKVVVKKLAWARYRLSYIFKTGLVKVVEFYSMNRGVQVEFK